MEAFLGLLLIFWVLKSAADKGRKEYRATREHHAAQIARDHKDWHPRRVSRAAGRRATSYWWNELNAWPPFPSFRAAFAEDRMVAKVTAAEAKAGGASRWRDLRDRLKAAEEALKAPAPVAAAEPEPEAAGPLPGGPDDKPDDSVWLKPGEPRCGLCGGAGRNKAGNDACPACRGFGSAPDDPEAPEAPPGTICGACGNPARPGDPVLTAPGGPIHRTHAEEMQVLYRAALIRDDLASGRDDAAIDDAVIGAGHGFEGEFDPFPEADDPETWPPLSAVPDTRAPSPAANGTPTKGTDMTSPAIYDTALEGADTPHEAMQGAFRAFGNSAAKIAQAASDDLTAAAAVHGMDRDPQTMADIQEISDQAAAIQARADAAATGLASRHAEGAEYHSTGTDAHASAYRPA